MDNKAIGMRIKSIRLHLGLSTEKFAKQFHEHPPSKGTISKWENGHYLPNNERLKKIAELGNTTVEYLLYGSIDEYANKLLSDFKVELENDKTIKNAVIPFIIEELRMSLFPTFLGRSYNDVQSLETFFEKNKKSAIERWSDYEKIENNVLNLMSHTITSVIDDSKQHLYKDFYENEDSKIQSADYITNFSKVKMHGLDRLDTFQRAFVDLFRHNDIEKIEETIEELNKIIDSMPTTYL